MRFSEGQNKIAAELLVYIGRCRDRRHIQTSAIQVLSSTSLLMRASFFYCCPGKLENTHKDLVPEQKVYAHKHAPTNDLVEAVDSIGPSILIGVSTLEKVYTRAVIETISK